MSKLTPGIEKTGTTYKCNNCPHKWDYQDTHCPECGSENFEDDEITLGVGKKLTPELNGSNNTIESIIENIRKQMLYFQSEHHFDTTFDFIDEDLSDIESLLTQQKEAFRKGWKSALRYHGYASSPEFEEWYNQNKDNG